MAALLVDILDGTRAGRLGVHDIQFLDKHLRRCGEILRIGGELRVRLVEDEEMATAHQRFSGVEGTTDVLTFDLSSPNSRAGAVQASDLFVNGSNSDRFLYTIDVDLLVCVDEAERQAALRGYPWKQEALLYALHGLLHCLGHDDHDQAGYEAMHNLEDRILAELGVEARFGSARAD